VSRSIHEKIDRVRKPRVHIKYKVEIGDAEEEKELPFIVGTLGDFSGTPMKRVTREDEEFKSGKAKEGELVPAPLKPLKDRKFIQIDRDNFDDVMKRMTPGLNLRVENTLKGDGTEMGVQLTFEKMEDFEPGNVVKQVPALRKLLETRDKLRDLMTKVDRSDELESLLEKLLQSPDQIKKIAEKLGGGEAPKEDK